MRMMIALAVVMLTVPAFAGPKDRAEWNPPVRYDHAYTGRLTKIQMSQPKVVDACKKLLAQYRIPGDPTRGCAAITAPGECTVIFINKPYRGTRPEAVFRHEVGHCNGWHPSHPE